MMSQVTHTFHKTIGEHTRKQVQMNAVARSIAMPFRKKQAMFLFCTRDQRKACQLLLDLSW